MEEKLPGQDSLQRNPALYILEVLKSSGILVKLMSIRRSIGKIKGTSLSVQLTVKPVMRRRNSRDTPQKAVSDTYCIPFDSLILTIFGRMAVSSK
jgi:hypothetical protein